MVTYTTRLPIRLNTTTRLVFVSFRSFLVYLARFRARSSLLALQITTTKAECDVGTRQPLYLLAIIAYALLFACSRNHKHINRALSLWLRSLALLTNERCNCSCLCLAVVIGSSAAVATPADACQCWQFSLNQDSLLKITPPKKNDKLPP